MTEFAGIRLDTRNECLWRGGVQVTLPPKPFLVLRYLVEHPGRLITHDELLDALWPETYVQPQVLRTYVLELRKLLGDDAGQPRFIRTVPKRGYCFVAAIEGNGGEQTGAARVVEKEVLARGIVGRAEELGRLEAALAGAARGQRQIVFVAGESGIGKTALVDAFCQGHARVARGQCVEGFGGRDEYYPVMEALGALCRGTEGEAAWAVLARLAPGWLAGLGREPAMHASPLLAGERRPGDLCAALEAMAAERPLILVLEDVQWADPATLELLSALARRRGLAQLMVVATCGCGTADGTAGARLTGGAGGSAVKALKQNLVVKQLCAEVKLGPLTRTEIEVLLRRELQQETLPAGLAGFVHQRSEGNPLFAMAILEHLTGRDFLVRAGGNWSVRGELAEAEADVPERLAQMMEMEMEGLSAEEQRILGAGSVMGIAFPSWAVAAALDEELARVEETCGDLARRLHFLERGGQDELPDGTRSDFYVFVHGLYREVLYQRQAAGRRAQWHARIGDRLGELFRGREAAVARERSLHYEAAGDWRRASATLSEAARYARDRQVTTEARHLVEQAVCAAEHLPGTERSAALEEIQAVLTNAEVPQVRRRDAERNLTKSGRNPDDRSRGEGAA